MPEYRKECPDDIGKEGWYRGTEPPAPLWVGGFFKHRFDKEVIFTYLRNWSL